MCKVSNRVHQNVLVLGPWPLTRHKGISWCFYAEYVDLMFWYYLLSSANKMGFHTESTFDSLCPIISWLWFWKLKSMAVFSHCLFHIWHRLQIPWCLLYVKFNFLASYECPCGCFNISSRKSLNQFHCSLNFVTPCLWWNMYFYALTALWHIVFHAWYETHLWDYAAHKQADHIYLWNHHQQFLLHEW